MSDSLKLRLRDRGVQERPKGSGIWWAVWYDEFGHKRRKKCPTQRLALQFRAKMQNEVFERQHFPDRFKRRNVPVSEIIDNYLARKRGTLRSLVNWERYAKQWKASLAGKTLRQIVPGDVDRYAAERRAAELSDASVNRELTLLRAIFNMAIDDGKADRNPVLSKFFVKENNQRIRYLMDEEEKQLREKIGDAEWPKVGVAFHTGLRQGNQFRLRWDDINFDTGMIRARESKSGEDYYVPMNDELRQCSAAFQVGCAASGFFQARRTRHRSIRRTSSTASSTRR
jgi:integrase